MTVSTSLLLFRVSSIITVCVSSSLLSSSSFSYSHAFASSSFISRSIPTILSVASSLIIISPRQYLSQQQRRRRPTIEISATTSATEEGISDDLILEGVNGDVEIAGSVHATRNSKQQQQQAIEINTTTIDTATTTTTTMKQKMIILTRLLMIEMKMITTTITTMRMGIYLPILYVAGQH